MQASTYINRPILKRGSTGSQVEELQELLKKRVPLLDCIDYLDVNGIFCKTTEVAVKVFQFRVFLEDDGIVGLKTWQALYLGERLNLPLLRYGSRSRDVAQLQNVLKFTPIVQDYMGFNGYYFGAIDGEFGLKTEQAVKVFQEEKELLVDGVIGTKTWKSLMNLASIISHIHL
ncbi:MULTISPECIES: peptidoglycan-binding domain-containing protein [Nostocales]|uniref:Peptidoglycan-binding protein n=3 Tax=Nostocales TaxID=1161 RepID=A0A0C1QPV1_9CYAN|nr:peptidoglycan-binding protein [Tolypothrix bouteillei]KAF3888951.1 peptidoglycan-binding protein [Tolypothrix bouteillei VB521301]